MGELESEYGDQATFTIVSAEETARSQADIEAFGFTEKKHGLVVFGPSGEPVAKLPGHSFGRDEIEEGLRNALAAR